MIHVDHHAIIRAKERYGLELNGRDLVEIAGLIKAKRSLLQGRQESGSEQHILDYLGVRMTVIYKPDADVIVTFLPKGATVQKDWHEKSRARKHMRGQRR